MWHDELRLNWLQFLSLFEKSKKQTEYEILGYLNSNWAKTANQNRSFAQMSHGRLSQGVTEQIGLKTWIVYAKTDIWRE